MVFGGRFESVLTDMHTVLFCQLRDGDKFIDRQGNKWEKTAGLRRLNAIEVTNESRIPSQTFFSATTQVTKVDADDR